MMNNDYWFDHIWDRVETVFVQQLVHQGRFAELHVDDKPPMDEDAPPGKRHVGIWGWNTWCGIHDLTPLVDERVHSIMRRTFDEGFSHREAGIGLFPHSIPIDRDGRIGYRDGLPFVEYRTYGGIHGEDYCLDNIICWEKMILEFFLYTRDGRWFTAEKLSAVEESTDYVIDHMRSRYNPSLVETGVEGDWTENTDWNADNSNTNACLIHCLSLLVETERALGHKVKAKKYEAIKEEIRQNFNLDIHKGGFWSEKLGFYVHGNDGHGERLYGDKYFESTANIFALLWNIAPPEKGVKVWSYINGHPEIERPFPVLTNHGPRNQARRMNYGFTVTDGDVWLTLGAHASSARLKSGFRSRGTEMYKSIIDYELKEGTIHNNIYADGSSNKDWSPEMGNYGALFTPLVEGVLGLEPKADGLWISPSPLEGMRKLKLMQPLSYAGKHFYLEISWEGNQLGSAELDGKTLPVEPRGLLLHPEDLQENSRLILHFR